MEQRPGRYLTKDQNKVICPRCGHEHKDFREMDDGTYDCDNCGNDFHMRTTTSIKYSTSREEK